MKKINTHQFFRLATSIHPVAGLADAAEDTFLKDWFFVLWTAERALLSSFFSAGSIYPETSRRAASSLIDSMRDVGVEADLAKVDFNTPIPAYKINDIIQKAKDLETVLANDLPGLDTYHVSKKSIYSTSALVDSAEDALLDSLPEVDRLSVPESVVHDLNQAGKCLAFELPTASGFHTMRAVEGLLRLYWTTVTKPGAAVRPPEMAQCVNELRKAGESNKIQAIVDHIRENHRNPLMHPEDFLDLNDALRLFDLAKSALSAMAQRISDLEKVAKQAAAAAAASKGTP